MKRWVALIALCILFLTAIPAMSECGTAPNCPGSYLAGDQVAQLEHRRQLQAVGGITASPYWLKQGFLCGRSISLRLFEVEKPMLPTQLIFKERLRYAQDGSGVKELLLTLNREASHVELRVGSDALELFERADIARIIVRDVNKNTIQVYERKDIEDIIRYFALTDGEVICLQGEDAPMYAHDQDGVRRVITP